MGIISYTRYQRPKLPSFIRY